MARRLPPKCRPQPRRRIESLRRVIFADHEVVSRQAGDHVALLVGNHGIQDHVARGRVELRRHSEKRRLLRRCGSGWRSLCEDERAVSGRTKKYRRRMVPPIAALQNPLWGARMREEHRDRQHVRRASGGKVAMNPKQRAATGTKPAAPRKRRLPASGHSRDANTFHTGGVTFSPRPRAATTTATGSTPASQSTKQRSSGPCSPSSKRSPAP